ncbi:fumarylacetoacetate hydrolase family protein [Marinovum sp. SP66]|uniref:fumarylacetoacetate hydrolase family protein n=1 Tax=Marinovum TaxID=367771 RepID=UPI00237AE639|nr:fumarylacetoacetate hydrolase family protein [Marinovum sp. SP66]MDD9739252.1 fumarylacetoacetate hydrolase family protein [Marinovum sp. SP66]
MKLVTFEIATPVGRVERIGALTDAGIVDLNLACAAQLAASGDTGRPFEIADALLPPEMIGFLAGGALSRRAANEALDFVAKGTRTGPDGAQLLYAEDAVRLLAPVPRPNSIRDTLSFEGHMINFERRTGKKTPPRWYEAPIYYKGNPMSVIGPEEEVPWPDYTEKLDYELEFGIYIGKEGVNISEEDAPAHIGGYTIFNDISARDVIPGEVQMFLGPAKGKDMDRGNIMGPCLVTPDELDAGNLEMMARINGEEWSRSNSTDMYHSFARIIAYISRHETLYPGDFIGSGTVANGCGDEMERWIKPGDVVELEVEGIGILRNRIAEKKG